MKKLGLPNSSLRFFQFDHETNMLQAIYSGKDERLERVKSDHNDILFWGKKHDIESRNSKFQEDDDIQLVSIDGFLTPISTDQETFDANSLEEAIEIIKITEIDKEA